MSVAYYCMYTRSEMTVVMTKMTEAEELRSAQVLPYLKVEMVRTIDE